MIKSWPSHGRLQYSIRGTISQHIEKRTGFWIFSRTYRGVLVKLNSDQLELVRERYGDVMILDKGVASVPKLIEIFMPSEKLGLFPLGSNVGVTFAQASQLEQFFRKAVPMAVIDLVPTTPKTQLLNEQLPVQIQLVV